MPYFTGGAVGPNADAVTLDDFPSSAGLALGTAAGEAWDSNPTSLAADWFRFRSANRGDRLAKADAEAQVKQAGVKLTIPDDGYTPEALDILIRRKHEEARRQDIMARAPTGIVPTTTRFAAQLLASVVDPLNVASAFIPVVGQARYVSMLANAGEGLLARSGVRALVGAAEGAAGAALLEPLAYGVHQQLQDDYHMSDSLLNVAFGAAFGSVLHAGAGAVGDAMRGGAHPAARYAGMSVEDVRTALDFERERPKMYPADAARALETYSPEVRRALGAGDVAAPVHVPGEPLDLRQSAAEVHARMSPEMQETAMRAAVADLVNGRTPDVQHIVGMDPASERAGSSLDAVRALTERQAQPEAAQLADFFAARQAEQRIAETPATSAPVEAATADLADATERLQSIRQNLELGGHSPEKLQAAVDGLKPFDDAVNDAKAMGEAVRAAALCGVRS